MKKWICFFSIAFAVYSCIEPYEPEVGTYDSTIVVDGIFTDGQDTSTIILTRSYAYSGGDPEFLTQATVIIEDDQGNRATLSETAPGKYQNDPAVFSGRPGRSYRLLIITLEGDQFESDWETLKSSPLIENVYFENGERPFDDPNLNPVKGVQLLLNTRDPENNTRFYRWEYEETYQFGLIYPPQIRVEFGNPPARGNDEVFFLGPDEYEGYRCWKTVRSSKLLIASTEDFTQDIIEAFPLKFVDNRSPRLYNRYSLLVKQYAISEDYYDFLKTIEATNQTTGSLFDPIPNELFGNIRSSDGNRAPVLGYFAVAGIDTSRFFISREELPVELNPPYGPNCPSDTIPYSFGTLYNAVFSGNRILYNYTFDLLGNPNGYLLTWPDCALCSASDATNVRPDFW